MRRVRGCGMPRPRLGGKGDLFLQFSVLFPTKYMDGEACRMLRKLLPATASPGAASAARVGSDGCVHDLESSDAADFSFPEDESESREEPSAGPRGRGRGGSPFGGGPFGGRGSPFG